MASRVKVLLVPLIIGIVILVLGCVLGFVVFPTVLEKEVENNVVLKEDTLQWYRFREIPFPIQFHVHLFSVENPNEILLGEKPIVKEKGPYVYLQNRVKEILSVGKDTVKYNERCTFTFDQKLSGENKEDDVVQIINPPFIAILQSLEDLPFQLPYSLDSILDDVFEDAKLFVKVKVRDFAFDGIRFCDPGRSTTGWSKLVCFVVMLLNQKFIEYKDDRSLLFSGFNYKTNPDGPFLANRGINDLDKLGLITEYKGKRYTEFWVGNNNDCDKVEGRYSTFPPFIEKDTKWRVYSTDICKSGVIHYEGESTFKDVSGYRFAANKESFSSASETCVCINTTKGLDGDEHCYYDGVVDMNSCFNGIPIVLSFPHLMWAGEEYQDSVLGLNSKESDHGTLLDFEPTIGFPLRGVIRIQFNMVSRPVSYGGSDIPITANLPRSLIPLLWVQESFELTDDLIEELNSKLLSNLVLMEGVKWGFIGVGIFLVVLSIGLCIFYNSRKK